MKKYIDVTKYSGYALVPVYLSEDGFAGFEKVDNLATADVQEVVRCKDCVYLAEDMKCPYCDYWESVTYKDDFCSNGMQMDGDEK